MSTIMKNNIIVSPKARDIFEIPKIPLMDYVLKHFRAKKSTLRDKIFMEAVDHGENIKFDDVEMYIKRYASALTRLGFKKGDLLYYCTWNINHLYLLRYAVWLLGGITRGRYSGEAKEANISSLKSTPPKIIVVDEETYEKINDALSELNMSSSVKILCFGNVPGAIPVLSLLNDDGQGIPDKIEIDPVKDILILGGTSGSTGEPKTIPHTSYSTVSFLQFCPDIWGKKVFQYGTNSGIASVMMSLLYLMNGTTFLWAAHFKNELFIDWLLKFKPERIFTYAFLSNWFARTVYDQKLDLNFIKVITVGASVVDIETLNILKKAFPHARIIEGYGTSETYMLCVTDPEEKCPKISANNGIEYAACGKLLPYVQAKIIDSENGRILDKHERGEIYIRSPQTFIGYLKPESFKVDNSCFDTEGWFRTGDVGFYDDEFNIYVVDRANFMFKYRGGLIAPSEIESCLNRHEAVQACAVIPIPDKDNDNLARAYVILRPGKLNSVTEQDIIDWVAKHLNSFKQLHGGVRFIKHIPENISGKMDRLALKKIALSERN